MELYDYLIHKKEGLIPYKLREDIKFSTSPKGKFKNYGTQHLGCFTIKDER